MGSHCVDCGEAIAPRRSDGNQRVLVLAEADSSRCDLCAALHQAWLADRSRRMLSASLTIRPAEPADIPLLVQLIRELAETEKFPFPVTVTEDLLRGSLFGRRPAAEAVLGFVAADPVGFAVFYQTFATTTGRPGLHLDDLFVRPAFQRRGFGKALLGHVAAIAQRRGCARFEWWALRWNEQALGFYRSMGAHLLEEIAVHRMEGEGLDRLAREASPAADPPVPRAESEESA